MAQAVNKICKIYALVDPVTKEVCYKSKKVLCIDTGILYKSVKQATETTGIWNIANCCRGLYKSAGGCTWRYT